MVLVRATEILLLQQGVVQVPTAFACTALPCFLAWSQALTVMSTTAWQGIGAGPCALLVSPATGHTTLREIRPLGITSVYS